MPKTRSRRSVLNVLDPSVAPGERDSVFHAAERHSRRVRLLRRVLPVAAIGGGLLVAFIVWLDPFRAYRELSVELARVSIAGNRLTIDAPRLTGFTQDRRPYWVTAQSATQDLSRPNVVELADIVGQVDLSNRGETNLRAKTGFYDVKSENLRLEGGVDIRSAQGYRVWLRDAFVGVRTGRVATDRPVEAIFPDGKLTANRLDVFDHGERIVFGGGVTVTVEPPARAGSETADAKR